VVFFPRTILPLHVFEPRYRTLVEDAITGEGLIAVSLLRPGWELNYSGAPAFFEIGTIGRLEETQKMNDGRFNIRLLGMQRVRLGEVVRSVPYRAVRTIRIEERGVDEADPRVREEKLNLMASHGCLLRELADADVPSFSLDESVTFEAAVNGVCANLPMDADTRQSLLEENDLTHRYRRVQALLDDLLERVLRLKSLRSHEEGGNRLN
jgi:hypothetical protein